MDLQTTTPPHTKASCTHSGILILFLVYQSIGAARIQIARAYPVAACSMQDVLEPQ